MLALLFGLSRPVSRKQYLLAGVLLMGLKYAIDAGFYFAATGAMLDPLSFLSPLLSTRETFLREAEGAFAVASIVVALPFLWIGASMTLRRAVDAGKSPWLVFLFLVPVVNIVAMLVLAALPSAPNERVVWYAETPEPTSVAMVKSALLGCAAGVGVGVLMVLPVSAAASGYGTVLFFVTPFVMGAVSAFLHNKNHARSVGNTVLVGIVTVGLAGTAILLFALEGVLCLLMAAPIGATAGVVGALIGRAIALRTVGPGSHVAIMLLALPLLAAAETSVGHRPLREVATSLEIDAPPAKVWPNVVGFSELPPPNRLYFELGIAYPQRARIEGSGVGAVRHCEFSTGPFVEPITRWEPPHRLSFDVVAQPPPMHEWSPYDHLHTPHLDGYLTSERGEFRLIPLDGGTRTRLEGSTWYRINIFPAPYWTLFSDALIHSIHERVLTHIAHLSR